MVHDSVLIPVENVEQVILQIRGQKVILDADLARLYGVETKVLNQAVKRNMDKFPEDFAFRITRQEVTNLKSQNVTSRCDENWSPIVISSSHGGKRKLPRAFTEHGALMAANVLRSKRAVLMSVYVVRAFVRLRYILTSHADLVQRLNELEKKYDAQFKIVFETIRQLMQPPEPSHRQIGFRTKEK
ncbi:MAG: ORF6N domain-containing protein [Gemmatimonadota bacterium]|nr:MAG: ORF6N domain-containing protein [Gemmatimonadota bacterium]